MNYLEAISILLAAERDPSVLATADYTAARAMVEGNAEMLEWYEAERGFYAVNEGLLTSATLRPQSRERIRGAVLNGTPSKLGLSDTLSETVPDEVLAAGSRGSHKTATAPSAPPIAFPRRSLLWLAAAAAALLIGMFIIPQLVGGDGSSIKASTFAEFGSKYLDGPVSLESTKTVSESFAHLEGLGSPCCTHTFAPAMDTDTMGCRVLSWNDHKISLICLKLDNNQVVHFMTMELDDLDEQQLAALKTTDVLKVNKRETQTWVKNDKVFMALAQKRNAPLDFPTDLVRL